MGRHGDVELDRAFETLAQLDGSKASASLAIEPTLTVYSAKENAATPVAGQQRKTVHA